MQSLKAAVLFAGALCPAACTTYKAKPQLRYDHGPNVPGRSITILRASAGEIAFEIRVKFIEKQLYHLMLEGDNPVAEGWFPTIRAGAQSYSVTLKPSEGLASVPGKTYRLCIG